MKETVISKAVDEVIALKLASIDIMIRNLVDPLGEVGNPEKVIGKSYEDWTPEDFQKLVSIYGQKEPTPLSNLVFKKEYAKTQMLETLAKE